LVTDRKRRGRPRKRDGTRRNGIKSFFAERVQTKELCVDDICVTRDQFAEVFGSSQSAAAAGAPQGKGGEAPSGSSAAQASTGDEGTVPENHDAAAAVATSTLEVSNPANGNETASTTPVGADAAPAATPADAGSAAATTDPGENPVPKNTPAEIINSKPANDNQPSEELPATGTE
jgi:hypothetical protein